LTKAAVHHEKAIARAILFVLTKSSSVLISEHSFIHNCLNLTYPFVARARTRELPGSYPFIGVGIHIVARAGILIVEEGVEGAGSMRRSM
jgi:hypothetical protein